MYTLGFKDFRVIVIPYIVFLLLWDQILCWPHIANASLQLKAVFPDNRASAIGIHAF